MIPPLRDTFECLVRVAPDHPLPARLFLPGTGDPRPDEFEYSQAEVAWLIGTDLYNHGFFWEAHEAWEHTWLQQPRQSSKGLFVRGCIQTAAALLKLRLHNMGGVRKLSQRSMDTLQRAEGPSHFGVDLPTLCLQLKLFWSALEREEWPLLKDFPRILVS